MWTCDTMFIWTLICILIVWLSFYIQQTFLFYWEVSVRSSFNYSARKHNWCGLNRYNLPWVHVFFRVQPMLHAGWNMFDQHLHCIIYTSLLISWVTMNPRSFLSSMSKHLAIASVSGNVKVCEAGGSMSMCCCTLAFIALKV